MFELEPRIFSTADKKGFGVGGRVLLMPDGCFGLCSGGREAGFKGDSTGCLELRAGDVETGRLVSILNGEMLRIGRLMAFDFRAEL